MHLHWKAVCAGSKLGLGVMCNLNGVSTVMRHVFAERKDWKKALAVGTAGAVGLVIGQNEDHLQGLMQAGANHLPGLVANHLSGLVAKHLPGQLAKLATSSAAAPAAASQLVSGAASAAGAAVSIAGTLCETGFLLSVHYGGPSSFDKQSLCRYLMHHISLNTAALCVTCCIIASLCGCTSRPTFLLW